MVGVDESTEQYAAPIWCLTSYCVYYANQDLHESPREREVVILGPPATPEQPPDLSLEPFAPIRKNARGQNGVERDHDVDEAGDPAVQEVPQSIDAAFYVPPNNSFASLW